MASAARELIDRIARNDPTLTDLNLRKRYCDEYDLRAIMRALRANTCVTSLDLCGTPNGRLCVREVAEMLRVNVALTNLDMSQLSLASSDAREIAGALRPDSALTHLNLGENNIKTTGIRAIANAIARDCSLTRLGFCQAANFIDGDFEALKYALKTNTKLIVLEIGAYNVAAHDPAQITQISETWRIIARCLYEENRGRRAHDPMITYDRTRALTYCAPVTDSRDARMRATFHILARGQHASDSPLSLLPGDHTIERAIFAHCVVPFVMVYKPADGYIAPASAPAPAP